MSGPVLAEFGALGPYVALVVFGFLPSEIWRWLAIILAKDLQPDSEILVFVRAMATALLAGVTAKVLFYPPGALASVAGFARFGAVGLGLALYFAAGRSILAGFIGGLGALLAAALVLAG